jgi:cell division protein FtsL
LTRKKLLILIITVIVLSIAAYLIMNPSDRFAAEPSINADGSISASVPIQREGSLYTFTGYNHQRIFIRKSNIILEGNGYSSNLLVLYHVTNVTVQNLRIETTSSYDVSSMPHLLAMVLDCSSNNTIVNVTQNNYELSLRNSHNNIITQSSNMSVSLNRSNNNTVSNNSLQGIDVYESTNNLILRNNAGLGWRPEWIGLQRSSNNLIFGNRINNETYKWLSISDPSKQNLFAANEIVGPFVVSSYICSENNLFYHNNFINAWEAKYPTLPQNIQTNNWNNTNEGNYWSNYEGQDSNHDGIGDTPYIIDVINQDNYPLVNPINIEQEPQPNQALYAADTTPTQTETTIILTVTIASVMLAVAIGIYKRKKTTQVLSKIDKNSFKLAAIASILNGIMLTGAYFCGFGSCLTVPYYRGGWATYGHLNRFSILFQIALAISIVFTGLGYRKLAKAKGDPYATYKLLPVIGASATLLSAAGLLTTAQPYYIDGIVGPYWYGCFFNITEHGVIFTHLTIITFALLGLSQFLWGRTQVKPNNQSKNLPTKISGYIQVLSGIVFILLAIWLYLPFTIPGVSFDVILLFTITQTLSAIIFIKQRKTENQEEH